MTGSAEVRNITGREQLDGMREAISRSHEADVRLDGVSKRYGDVWALRTTELTVKQGEFFSILGASGSGKTTTLRIIGGFEEATGGRVFLQGHDVTDTPPYERNVNTVFQDYALFPHMSVRQNVEYGLRMRRVDRRERERRVAEALALVRLSGFEGRRPAQLSGGQRQRVALARALVNMPAVLLLDEPLGALDLKLRREMQIELKRIQRDVGITFIYVTHDQEEAMSMSDRVAVMSDGRIVQVGAPNEVYERPANVFVAGFVGVSNLLPGMAERQAGGLIRVAIDGCGTINVPASLPVQPGQAVHVMVRPERIEIRQSPQDASPHVTVMQGRVIDVSYTGPFTRYAVATGRHEMAVVEPNKGVELVLRLGEEVWLSWTSDNSYLLSGSEDELRRGREALTADRAP